MIIRDIVSPAAKPWDIDCSGDAPVTKQEFKKDCDVNLIIARCVKSGLPLPSVTAEPLYADLTKIGSYRECLDRVNAANDAFMELPADIRSEFGNDPGQLLNFIADPRNLNRAVELGLVVMRPKDAKDPTGPTVPAVPTANAAPAADTPTK